MRLVSQVQAMMGTIQPGDFDAMPPAERRRFADLARYVADMAEPRSAKPKSRVLAELQNGGPRPRANVGSG